MSRATSTTFTHFKKDQLNMRKFSVVNLVRAVGVCLSITIFASAPIRAQDLAIWRYTGNLKWEEISQTSTASITADGYGNLYQIKTNNSIWFWDVANGWQEIDGNNQTEAIIADNQVSVFGLFLPDYSGVGEGRAFAIHSRCHADEHRTSLTPGKAASDTG
jgi:hypothetical protein